MSSLEYIPESKGFSYEQLNHATFVSLNEMTPGWVLGEKENVFEVQEQQAIYDNYHKFYHLIYAYWIHAYQSDILAVEFYIKNYESLEDQDVYSAQKLEDLDRHLFSGIRKDESLQNERERDDDKEAEVVASFLLGFAIAEFFSHQEVYFDNADMHVALSAHINGFFFKATL